MTANSYGRNFTVKVPLLDLDPPIWRCILVDGATNFQGLQLAMGWENIHLYTFKYWRSTFAGPWIHMLLHVSEKQLLSLP
ncbi:IS1096 element passenger TnpR family protein [Candidatus Neptunochlamydia vexilliferae]|uniref:IS1096 element passenger TnpR family protein n=1 Tax=Candidatus Neptunichlamydia vexilliferae TaxID=1651774 RepID=UPI001891523E